MKEFATAVAVLVVCVVVTFGCGVLLAPTMAELAGVASIWWFAALCFGVNWLAWIPASALRSERFYDLTGSFTFLSVVGLVLAVATSGTADAASGSSPAARLLPALLVVIWTLRLGSFLVARIRRTGVDGRFDELKTSPVRFFVPWTLQGLWVFLMSLPMIVQGAGAGPRPLSAATFVGLAIWLFGFVVEVVADRQKTRFAADPQNRGHFITTGLWAWSRHPNYFGEIVLWLGVFVMGAGHYAGPEWVVVVSPVFAFVLLRFVSGVPLLERRADARFGHDAAYVAWRDATPVLLLRPPRR
jgi:steroid 5-alpha reductase family enzyme